MTNVYNPSVGLQNILLDGMGNGFSEIVLGKSNTALRQLRSRMNRGDKKAYCTLRTLLYDGICRFDEGVTDESEAYCPHTGSDEYDCFTQMAQNFLYERHEDFFYETRENAIAYRVAQCILPACQYTSKSCMTDTEAAPLFRKEYYTAASDVLTHFCATERGNGTFYKWVIKAFKTAVGKEDAFNAILCCVFTQNDGSVATTFEKLKNERGNHYWGTFDALFKNEQHNEDLKKLLKKEEVLKAYQVFQSRMLVAFFFENLRAALPAYIGQENTDTLWELLISQAKEKAVKQDAEAVFLSADREQKNERFSQAVEALFWAESRRDFLASLEMLDKSCYATKLFACLAMLTQTQHFLPNALSAKDKEQYRQQCKDYAFYYGQFADICGFKFPEILW